MEKRRADKNMSSLNRSLAGPRMPARPLPPPRFGIAPVMLPRMPPPPIFTGYMRPRLPLPRLSGNISRPNGMLPMFPGGPRARVMTPIVTPPMVRGSGPGGPFVRPWMRKVPSPQIPHGRRRYITANEHNKGQAMKNQKNNKLKEVEFKKPWMTDEIRNEIQQKNKLYIKARKNKKAVEWEELRDIRNKINRMIKDAKINYLAKHPEQAHLYPDDEDQKESNIYSDEDTSNQQEICDTDYPSEEAVSDYQNIHTCGVNGCTYTANYLLVEKHLRVEHNKNLFPENKNVPPSFIKWMMERRRKFLEIRKTNELKELEKLERGEIIKQVCNVEKKIINTREKRSRFRKRRIREIDNDNACTVDTYRGLRPFPGIGILQREEEEKVCLSEKIEQADLCEKVICNVSNDDSIPQVTISESTNSLMSILVNYSETDDDEAPEEVSINKLDFQDDIPIKKVKVNEETSTQIHEETCNVSRISTSSTDVQCTDTNTHANKINKKPREVIKYQHKEKNEKKQNFKEKIVNNKYETFLHKYHNKFLENLLSRDIQHERNLICQCMKYIVDNNFFDLNESL